MKNEIIDIVENEMISETEIVDLLFTTSKMVKLEILKQSDLDYLCETLGVKQTDVNVFELDEDNSYTFN